MQPSKGTGNWMPPLQHRMKIGEEIPKGPQTHKFHRKNHVRTQQYPSNEVDAEKAERIFMGKPCQARAK